MRINFSQFKNSDYSQINKNNQTKNQNVAKQTEDENIKNIKQNEEAEKESENESQDKVVREMKKIEQEVIAHELAHISVGGKYVGPASYSYTVGPDGKTYINGGEVSIDTSPENTPEETVQKMRQVRAAALAPAKPSGQDMSVAAAASQAEAMARQEIGKQDFAGDMDKGQKFSAYA